MKLHRLFFTVLLLATLLCPLIINAQTSGTVPSTPVLTAASQQLAIEQSRNASLAKKLVTFQQNKQQLGSLPIDTTMLQRADLAIALANADLDGITLTLTNAQQELNLTQTNIDNLQSQAQIAGPQQSQLQTQLKEHQALSELQQARIKVLIHTRNLAQQTLTLAQDWKTQLQSNYQLQQQQSHQQTLNELTSRLQKQQQDWLMRLATLNQQLATAGAYGLINSSTYVALEMSVFAAEEHSNLSQGQLDLARLRNSVENLALIPEQNLNLTTLNNAANQADTLNQQLNTMQNGLQAKINLLQKRMQISLHGMQNGAIAAADGKNNLDLLYGLLNSYQKQLDSVTQLQKQALAYQDAINQQLKQHIASRQGLPGFDLQAWQQLTHKSSQIPNLTWQSLSALQQSSTAVIAATSPWQWLIWVLAIVAWAGIWRQLHRILALATLRVIKRQQDIPIANLFGVFLQLLKRFLPGFMLLGGFIGLLLLIGIPLQTFSLIIGLGVIALIFGLVISFTRILLLENTTDESGGDARLFYRLQWALRIGELITGLTFLVHQIPVAYSIQDLFGRLFMLFLLVVALVLLRGWSIVPAVLAPYLEGKPRYLKQVVRWLSLLVPLTILSNALIGLIGYVELAWSIAAYQGLFLIVLTGFLLVRGIVGELIGFCSGQMIRRLRNGWLWSEALLKPFHQILRIVIFFGAIAVLFTLYGWGWHSWVLVKLMAIVTYPLFTFTGSNITLLSFFKLFITLMALIWIARWSREFSYRWLYAGTKDLGVRNSLAIFTQYTLVTIGVLFGLNIIGINLTALTYIASAFVLGAGFGLRDLANNFVSGVLLLIERPIRVGDYVTLGGYDGEVLYIGMRSITVRTDDHQELLVPNAMVFSQSFVNWTHRDSIVRVGIIVKINRLDDIHRVKAIILEIIKASPKILTNPPPDVYLKEVNEALLRLEIEYYLDIRLISSRSSVRSQFLLALCDRFKAEGIHAPEVAHEIHITKMPGESQTTQEPQKP